MQSHSQNFRFGLALLSVFGLVFITLATPSLFAQDPEKTAPPPAAARQTAPPEGFTLPTESVAHILTAGEPDANAPAYVHTDPVDENPAGVVTATAPVPTYLKGTPYRLAFVSGDYIPADDERIDPLLVDGLGRAGRNYTYGYVMFQGELQQRKVRALEALGLRFGGYHTFNSRQARIPASALADLRVHPFVRWVGYARPEQKVDEFILEALMDPRADPAEALPIYVAVFESDMTEDAEERPIFDRPPAVPDSPNLRAGVPTVTYPNGPFQRGIEAAGGRVAGYIDGQTTFYVWATRAVIRKLMKLDYVAGMDMCLPPETDHDRSLRQTGQDYTSNLTAYDGRDTTVAIVDSGLYTKHSDINGKYAGAWDFSGEKDGFVDDLGHGTHVTGTVCGTGQARLDKRYRGATPGAGSVKTHPLYVVKILDRTNSYGPGWPNYGPTAWDVTRKPFVAWGVTTKPATVLNNSWGSGGRLTTGYYGTDTLSLACDRMTYSYRQVYVMSAGNKGGSSTAQFHRSNRPPCVAKAAFSVGNMLDYKPDTRYPGEMSYSSSKGPTRDGRMKPLVSAPGTSIRSVKNNSKLTYIDKSGTSMAAPHVTGLVAALQDNQASTYLAWPALLRARIMASSAPYAGVRTTVSTSSQSYINRRGLGQIDAYATLWSRPQAGGWQNGHGRGYLPNPSIGAYFDVAVPTDATRITVVLTWDEPAASLNAVKSVLADLDLLVDYPPFSSNINSGNVWSRSQVDNYEFIDITSGLTNYRGKTMRIKIPYKKKITSQLSIGMAYHITRGDTTPRVTLGVTASPTFVKPNQPVSLSGTVTVNDYRGNNVYVYADAPGFTVTSMSHTTRANRTFTYPTTGGGSTDTTDNMILGEVGPWWASAHRKVDFTLQSATEGRTTVYVRARGDTNGTAAIGKNICVDGRAPTMPASLRSTSHSVRTWTNRRSFTATWNAATDIGCAGVLGYGTAFGGACTPPPTRNLGAVTSYSTTLPASAGSSTYLSVRTWDRCGNTSTIACAGPYYLDTVAPAVPTSLRSSTHTTGGWSRNATFRMAWTAPPTGSGSPINGYSMLIDQSPTTKPGIVRNLGAVTTYQGTLAAGKLPWYFHLRAVDKAGNWGAAAHAGPFYVDTSAPYGGKISIDNGAASTTSLIVTLNGLSAMDSLSGVVAMRFSNNGTTWSPWTAYKSTVTGWNLSAYGGNTSLGTKRVYVQYRDRALNVSATVNDTIQLVGGLGITTIVPGLGPIIGGDTVTITGTGFLPGMRVTFDGVAATNVNVLGATKLTCRTPIHLAWERVDVRVIVGSLSRTRVDGYHYVGANVPATGDPKLATPFRITFNAPVDGGRPYLAAASLGAGPIALPPHLPLRLSPDSLFMLTANNRIPTVFGGLRGTLAANGQAPGIILLPNVPSTVGLRFYMAFVTIDATKPLGLRTVSAGRSFVIQQQ